MKDALRVAALSPVLIAQAAQVMARAERLPEAAGPRSGSLGQGAPLRLLIVGDSSAAGVGVDHQHQALSGQLVAVLSQTRHVSWQLVARTGATTRSTLATLDRMPARPFDVAVVALGVNDVLWQTPERIWRQRQARLAEVLTTKFGTSRLFRTAVPPLGDFPLLPRPLATVLGRHAARLDAALRADCMRDPRSVHLGLSLPLTPDWMARDGFHPNAALYALWGAEMARLILRPPEV